MPFCSQFLDYWMSRALCWQSLSWLGQFVYLTLHCCGLDRKVPVNFVLLALFTFCMSWLVATICMFYNQIVVFEAASLTFAVVMGLTFYAVTSKQDFTICGPIAFVLLMLVIMASILSMCFGPSMNLLWSFLGCFVFSFYIVIDT